MNKKLDNFLKQTLDQVMSDRFGRYSKYIIQERALPDVRDGLKPVQRRIIFSMHELGLFSNRPFKKSARVVGDVIGKYHPHGDSSIYEALVRMSQTWKMNVPLIEMHGNNGSIDDDPAAAMRYTEVRLSNITNDLINNLKKNTVLFAPNFDDSEKEPIVLPALLPNLLVNGARGIAAGYATEMPPHNLGEVVDAIIAKIKSPNIRLETLLNYMQGPDFSTGGIVQGKAGIYEALATGRGKIVIRSKYEINVLKTKPSITITEIPYGVIKSKLVREIDEIRFESKIDGIKQVRDESDRNGLAIFIELMPGTNFKQVVNYLLAKTEMQVYYHYNNVAIKNKVPTQMNLITLIDAYLEHQREIQTKALEYELTKDQRRFEIITGLIKVSEMADNVIKTITNASGSKQGVINTLIAEYGFTQLQATAIAELQLYRLSKGDQSLYLEEKVVLSSRIEINEQILNSPEKFNKHLINLLKNFKQQHAVPRKTIIEDAVETIAINMDALIKHEPTWVGVSKQGYIKRFSNRKYEANNLSNYTLKASDSLQYLDYINTQDKLLVFTSFGNYFFISVHKIVENKFQEVGKHLNDFAPLSLNEHIISAIAVHDFETNAYVVLVSQQGKGKRVPIKDFIVSRSSKLYKAMKLNAGDQLISAKVSNGFQQIVIITTSGYAVKYLETQLPLQGLKSVGVKAINLKNNQVSVMAVVAQNEILGLVSHRGGMKRIKVTSILPTARTTQGTIIYKSLRANKHIILNATPVLPNTKVFFSNTNLITHLFKDVDITSRDVGLSLVTSQKPIGALINHFVYVDKNNDYFESKTNIEAEDVFQQAEEVIDQVSQISLDDLLKDL